MKFCTTLVFLLYLWRTIGASNEHEAKDPSTSKQFLPQFLRDDELPPEFQKNTTAVSNENIERKLLNDTDENKATSKIKETTPASETDNTAMETDEYRSVIKNGMRSSEHEVHSNNPGAFRNISSRSNKSIEKQIPQDAELNGTSHNVTNSGERLKEPRTMEMRSNISVVFSKPYQPGKDLYERENITVVYPEKPMEVINYTTLDNKSLHEDDKYTTKNLFENEKTEEHKTDTTVNKEQTKQIRLDLYKRRPVSHYLLKTKNDTQIGSDEINTTKNETQDYIEMRSTTINPVSINMKTVSTNFENVLNDSMVEIVSKTRRRNGILDVHREINNTTDMGLQTENIKLNLTNLQEDSNRLKNISTGEIIVNSTKNDNLYSSETQLHTSVIYEPKNKKNGAEQILQNYQSNVDDTNKDSQTFERSTIEQNQRTLKPFKASPEFNPNDIRRYNMYLVSQPVQSTPPSHERSVAETSTKHSTVFENMMQMFQNIRRLPNSQQKIRNEPLNSSNVNGNDYTERVIENYESKKIRPSLQMNQASRQIVKMVTQRVIDRKHDRLTTNNKTMFQNRFKNMMRSPLKFLDRESRIPLIHDNNDESKHATPLIHSNLTDLNGTMHKPIPIEQILKANILKDLEKIRMMMSNRNQENTQEKPIDESEIIKSTPNVDLTKQQMSNPVNGSIAYRLSTRHKVIGNKRLNYLTITTEMPSSELGSDMEEPSDLQRNKNRKSNVRQRFQRTEVDIDLMTIPRSNYRRRPMTRRKNHEISKNSTMVESMIKQTENPVNNRTTITSENTIKQILNSRRRNRYKGRKTNENRPNNETPYTQYLESKKINNNTNLNFFNKEYENTISTTLSYEITNSNNNSKNSGTNFYNAEFEVNASGSEKSATVEIPLRSNNKTSINSDVNSNNMDDLESMGSQRHERSSYTGRFEPPEGFESGFVPMVFDLGGIIVGPVPRALKMSKDEYSWITQPKLPESVDEVDNVNIVSPNLLTNYGPNIGRIPAMKNNSEKLKQEKTADKENLKVTSTDYDVALKQYNDALKMYNSFLEQFILVKT